MMKNNLTKDQQDKHAALDQLTKRRTLLHDFLRLFGTDMLEGLKNNEYIDTRNTEQGVEVILTAPGAKFILDMEDML